MSFLSDFWRISWAFIGFFKIYQFWTIEFFKTMNFYRIFQNTLYPIFQNTLLNFSKIWVFTRFSKVYKFLPDLSINLWVFIGFFKNYEFLSNFLKNPVLYLYFVKNLVLLILVFWSIRNKLSIFFRKFKKLQNISCLPKQILNVWFIFLKP